MQSEMRDDSGVVFPETTVGPTLPERLHDKLTFCYCKFRFNCYQLQLGESFLPLLSVKQIESKTKMQVEEQCKLDFS